MALSGPGVRVKRATDDVVFLKAARLYGKRHAHMYETHHPCPVVQRPPGRPALATNAPDAVGEEAFAAPAWW